MSAARSRPPLQLTRSAVVAGGLLLACACAQSGSPPTGRAAMRALEAPGFNWRVIEMPDRQLRLYVQRNTDAEENAGVVEDSAERAQTEVLALLEEPRVTGDRAEFAALFFVGSRADMQRLSGRPIAGFVQPGEASAFFVWAPGYRAPLRHELAHLYTFERWGLPAGGGGATWLVEGIGAWAGGLCQGQSNDALAAGLLARDALPAVAELAERFRELPEDVAMPAAGSLTQYIHEREGIAGLRALWRRDSLETRPDADTEAAWRAHIASVPPGTLDVQRVMREGC